MSFGCGDEAQKSAPSPSSPSILGDHRTTAATSPTEHRTASPHAEAKEKWGTHGDDRLFGTTGIDRIDGLRGSDIIRGLAGDDVLRDYTGVGSGNAIDLSSDVFFGGLGDDEISSSGHDKVYAGPGDDTIYANYLKRGDVILCGPGWDVVIENDNYKGIDLKGCERLRIRYAG